MLSLNKKKITHSKSVVSAEEEKLYRLNKNFFFNILLLNAVILLYLNEWIMVSNW